MKMGFKKIISRKNDINKEGRKGKVELSPYFPDDKYFQSIEGNLDKTIRSPCYLLA